MPVLWTWHMQLQVTSKSGERLLFKRSVELPTLPQSDLIYRAAIYYPENGLAMIMKLKTQIVFPEEALSEAVFMLDFDCAHNAARRSAAYLTEMFEHAGWVLSATSLPMICKSTE